MAISGSEYRAKVRARREARKAESSKKSAAKKSARAEKRKTSKAAKAKKGEGTVAKTLRTWSPGKYAAKLIKGEPIGQSEKASPKKASSKKDAPKPKKGPVYKSKKSYGTGKASKPKAKAQSRPKKAKKEGVLSSWSPGKYIAKLIKGEPIGQPKKEEYAEGGKVESDNSFGWPTRDARNGGKK